MRYGINSEPKITAIENWNNTTFIFKEGSEVETQPSSFYLFTTEKFRNCRTLKGDLPYKYITQFDREVEYHTYKKNIYDYLAIRDYTEQFCTVNDVSLLMCLTPKTVSTLSFDIETSGLVLDGTSKVFIISNTFRSATGEIERKLFRLDEFTNEYAIIQAWCAWVQQKDPSVLIGHNIFSYDLPYLQHCAKKCGLNGLKLGRLNKYANFDSWPTKVRLEQGRTKEFLQCRIFGRQIVDTFLLAIKADITKKFDSYGLKPMIKAMGLEKTDRVFIDASKISQNWHDAEQRELICKYAEADGDDALSIYDEFINPIWFLNQSVPKSLQSMCLSSSGGQLNSMFRRCYVGNQWHSLPKSEKKVSYEGAISLGNPGYYENVWKVDVASLYPNIMITWDVYDKVRDPLKITITLLKEFTTERIKNKKLAKDTGKEEYKYLESAQKTFINSIYGLLGTEGVEFNYPNGAAEVTRRGREDVLGKSMDWAKLHNFTLVNADTDSISICSNKEEFLTEENRKIWLEKLNGLYPNTTIRFEDDGFFEKVLVLKAKNYVLVTVGKKKIKGSALKNARTEPFIKKFLMECVDRFLTNDRNIQDIYEKYIKLLINVEKSELTKKYSITPKTFSSLRKNETKIIDALNGRSVDVGDKVWLYTNDQFSLSETNDDKLVGIQHYCKRLYASIKIFETLLNPKEYINYSLKTKKEHLYKVLGWEWVTPVKLPRVTVKREKLNEIEREMKKAVKKLKSTKIIVIDTSKIIEKVGELAEERCSRN